MNIKLSTVDDALYLSEYYITNESHLKMWEPLREDGYNKLESWQERLKQREIEQEEKKGAYFIAYSNDETKIIATCNLTGITYGVFLACFMGYTVSKSYEGQGVMKKLCTHAIQYAFNELRLNRIMSNYMLNNKRSENLLNSIGFVKEGIANKYLFINGNWEDHILTSLLNHENT